MATANVTQVNVRWYDDDNSNPDSMTPAADQNATLANRQTGTANRMVGRVLMQNDNSALWNSATQWQYSRNSGAWTTLNGSSSYIRTTGGTPAVDESCATSVITGGTGTYTSGYYNEDDGVPPVPSVAKNNYTEFAICVYLVEGQAQNGDTIQVRLSGTAVATWTNVLTVTVSAGIITESRTDGVDLSDEVAQALDSSYSRTDGVDLSDEVAVGLLLSEARTDGVSLTDTAAAAVSKDEARTDGVEGSDSATYSLVTRPSETDGAQLSDEGTHTLIMVEARTDGVDLSDEVSETVAKAEAVTDGVDLSDSATSVMVFSKAVTDGAKAGDLATAPDTSLYSYCTITIGG